MKIIKRKPVQQKLYLSAVLACLSGLLMPLCATAQPAGATSLGGFAGYTDRADADFTLGLQYEYALQDRWSAGALLEHTPDVYAGSDVTLLLAMVHYRPLFNRRVKLSGGAGVEFNDQRNDDIVLRTGIGYDLLVSGPLSLIPQVALNFGNDNESVTLGASLLYRF